MATVPEIEINMHKLALFIYRLPLPCIVLCMVLLTFLWSYLGFRQGRSLRWRFGNGLVFLGTMAVIFYMTVYTRGESASEAILIPFQSFQEARLQPELYRSMLMNVFLFVPIGLSLPFVLGKGRIPIFFTVITALFFSAGIEYLQYRYALGRCEVDDIIMNTLGAAVGCWTHWLCRNWERRVIPTIRFLLETFRQIVNELRRP